MQPSEIKIIFFGTPEFSIPAFKFLFKNGYRIMAAVTSPDKPIGRNRTLTPPPVKIFARQNNITVFQPVSLKKDTDFFRQFKELMLDAPFANQCNTPTYKYQIKYPDTNAIKKPERSPVTQPCRNSPLIKNNRRDNASQSEYQKNQ